MVSQAFTLAIRSLGSLLGVAPTDERVAAALLGVPLARASAEVYRRADAALMSEAAAAAEEEDGYAANKQSGGGGSSTHREQQQRLHQQRQQQPEQTERTQQRDHPQPRPRAEVRQSLIPGAGAGLFLRGADRGGRGADRGDLVALYGGIYTPPAPDVTHGADGTSIIIPAPTADEEGQYVIHLQGGGYLDGAEQARLARQRAGEGRCEGWATAALANHPPAGTAPNVQAVQVHWGGQPRRLHVAAAAAAPSATTMTTTAVAATAAAAAAAVAVAAVACSLDGPHHMPVATAASSAAYAGAAAAATAAVAAATSKAFSPDRVLTQQGVNTSVTTTADTAVTAAAASAAAAEADVESIARRLINPATSAPWYIDGGAGQVVYVPRTTPVQGRGLHSSTFQLNLSRF